MKKYLILFTLLFSAVGFGANAKWTVMIYLNADNSLYKYGLGDMNEMEQVGSSADVNVVTFFDGTVNNDSKIYYMQKDSDTSKINSPVIQNMGEADMGSVKTLTDFVQFTHDRYPADHYLLIVWNHGSGWDKAFRAIDTKGISYDDTSGTHMTTPQLGQALAGAAKILGQKIDVYASDACLMNMLEVGYEIKDSANIMVGSQDLEPADGLEYDQILQRLTAKPDMSATDLAKNMVDVYVGYYTKLGTDNCYSAVDLTKMGAIASAYSAWGAEINKITSATAKEWFKTLDSVSYFYEKSYKDLLAAAKKFSGNIPSSSAVQQAVQSSIIANGNYGEDSFATGLSQWLPSASDFRSQEADFNQLQWAKDTGWSAVYKKLSGLSEQ